MHKKHGRFIRFLFTGGINTLFGYMCYAAAIAAHLPLPWALVVSQAAGVLFNFYSYKRLVFQANTAASRRTRAFTFIRFLVAYTLSYGLNLGLLTLLARNNVSPYLAQLLALIIVVPVTYGILRNFVWQNHLMETENVSQKE